MDHLERRLNEACQELYDTLVDPREPFGDDDGPWRPLGGDGFGCMADASAFATEQQHREIRDQCRRLAVSNEFAINALENRVNYLVGAGHTYRATTKKGFSPADALAAAVQAALDEFIVANQWHRRQQEIVRRQDRDGEVFLRFFTAADGSLSLRFVEPGQVVTPARLLADPAASFGIQTEASDVETVLAYYVDGQPIGPNDMQHRKANVDANVKRGLPLLFPVRKNLRRAAAAEHERRG